MSTSPRSQFVTRPLHLRPLTASANRTVAYRAYNSGAKFGIPKLLTHGRDLDVMAGR